MAYKMDQMRQNNQYLIKKDPFKIVFYKAFKFSALFALTSC